MMMMMVMMFPVRFTCTSANIDSLAIDLKAFSCPRRTPFCSECQNMAFTFSASLKY